MTEEEYLASELVTDIKHEFIDGEVYVMVGASKNHERISGYINRKIGNFLENSPCETFLSDVKVKAGRNFFYPEAMVVCDDQTEDNYYTESPTIIVEVLSRSTRRTDETIKRTAYQSIPSLQEFILIEQDFVDVEVCRRREGWLSKHYFLNDELILNSIGITVGVNEDVNAYLKAKKLSENKGEVS